MVGTSNLGSWHSHWKSLFSTTIHVTLVRHTRRTSSRDELFEADWPGRWLEATARSPRSPKLLGWEEIILEVVSTGWWFGTWLLWLSIQLGMSSSQLTFTPSFFRGVAKTTNQSNILGDIWVWTFPALRLTRNGTSLQASCQAVNRESHELTRIWVDFWRKHPTCLWFEMVQIIQDLVFRQIWWL